MNWVLKNQCIGAVCWGIVLQAGRPRIRFPLGHWDFSLTWSFQT